jgi:SOS-response transcriptional repressor LexA
VRQIVKKQLTRTQQNTLLAIHEFVVENGYFPTFIELAKKRGTAVQPTQYQVELLVDAGYLLPPTGKARGSIQFARTIEYQGQTIPVLGVCS